MCLLIVCVIFIDGVTSTEYLQLVDSVHAVSSVLIVWNSLRGKSCCTYVFNGNSTKFHWILCRGSSVSGPGWSSRYSDSLWTGRSGDRIPVWARFSAPVQTGRGVHPASCVMDTGSFPAVKRPGHGVDHPPQSSAEVKERVELYLYSTSGPSWPVIGWTFPFLQ